MPRSDRSAGDDLADSRRHLFAELLGEPRVVAREDEGPDPVLDRERGESLGELLRVRRQRADVQQAPDLSRVAADAVGRLVDRGVASARSPGFM